MVNWNANVDALLFKHILKLHDIKPNYIELEKAMRAEGVDATAKAITHRIGKIRSTQNDENQDTLLGPPTIKHRGPAGGKPAAKRGNKGEPKKVVSDGENFEEQQGDADAADEEPPKKKQKRAPRKKAAVKTEEEQQVAEDAI